MRQCPMHAARVQRTRVLDALERLVKSFRGNEDLHPLRVPHEPLSLPAIVDSALDGEARRFDIDALRTRALLELAWPDGSAWTLWLIVLPSKVKVYCGTGDDGSYVLASGGRNEGDAGDRLFLELFAASRGETFGVEMAGGLPSQVRSSIADRDFLVDLFVELFEGTEHEHAIRDRWRPPSMPGEGHDFRADVGRWLDSAGVRTAVVAPARLR
jgi:hypothetical protein